jgi:hypothetical protein
MSDDSTTKDTKEHQGFVKVGRDSTLRHIVVPKNIIGKIEPKPSGLLTKNRKRLARPYAITVE